MSSIYEKLIEGKKETTPYWYGRGILHPARYPDGAWKQKKPKVHPAYIDIVPDRHHCAGAIGDEGFWKWLGNEAFKAMTKWATDNWITTSSEEIFEYTSSCGKYVFRCTPNRSYGYMYMGAYANE